MTDSSGFLLRRLNSVFDPNDRGRQSRFTPDSRTHQQNNVTPVYLSVPTMTGLAWNGVSEQKTTIIQTQLLDPTGQTRWLQIATRRFRGSPALPGRDSGFPPRLERLCFH